MAKFSYCLLVWMFSNTIFLNKIKFLKYELWYFYAKVFYTSYEDLLLKFDSSSMLKFSKLWIVLIQALWKKFSVWDKQIGCWRKIKIKFKYS